MTKQQEQQMREAQADWQRAVREALDNKDFLNSYYTVERMPAIERASKARKKAKDAASAKMHSEARKSLRQFRALQNTQTRGKETELIATSRGNPVPEHQVQFLATIAKLSPGTILATLRGLGSGQPFHNFLRRVKSERPDVFQ